MTLPRCRVPVDDEEPRCPVRTPRSPVSRTRSGRRAAAVYQALLDARAVQRWMVPDDMTSEVHEFAPHEGGRLRISLTYEDQERPGKSMAHTDTYHGRFVRLVPDTEVVQVVEFETDDPSMRGEMTITYRLSDADGGGTLVEGRHENLPPGLSPRTTRSAGGSRSPSSPPSSRTRPPDRRRRGDRGARARRREEATHQLRSGGWRDHQARHSAVVRLGPALLGRIEDRDGEGFERRVIDHVEHEPDLPTPSTSRRLTRRLRPHPGTRRRPCRAARTPLRRGDRHRGCPRRPRPARSRRRGSSRNRLPPCGRRPGRLPRRSHRRS